MRVGGARRFGRRVCGGGLVACLALGFAGCRTARTTPDLSEPFAERVTASAPVAVVTDGRALPIVTDDAPDDRWAALFLAATIEEMTGVRPTVTVERKGQDCRLAAGLFLGDVCGNRGWRCALTNESAEAFRVVAGDGCVRFLGRADFAAFDWCERELGLRYYGRGAKSVVPRREIVVRARDYSDRPVFEVREIGNRWSEPWARVAKTGASHRGGVAVHQPHGWYTNAALKAAHPRIFETGDTPMLCYGNPETLAVYKERIDRHIAGVEDSGGIVDVRRKVVTVSPWDAPIRCACGFCRPLYDGASASPIVWGEFLRKLSAWLRTAHPDYEISFLPYLNFCTVPPALKGRPGSWGRLGRRGVRRRIGGQTLRGAEAELCTMPGLALLKDAACARREERLIRDWRRVTGRPVLNWHYLCWPQERTAAPYVFGRTIQAHYAAMTGVSCGSFVCGGTNDPRLLLSQYVWAKCLWNPDLDVEAVYDEFAVRLFGTAARPMRELIAVQEAGWERPWTDETCSHANIFGRSYPRETVLRMKALLAEAWRAAEAEPQARRHIAQYAEGFAEFFAESDALAARPARRIIRPGETNRLVAARSARQSVPWAATDVSTHGEGDALIIRVRCFEPAVARMDFTRTVNDFLWGNDGVDFHFATSEGVRTVRVLLTGAIEKPLTGFSASVTHEAAGWTVTARLRPTDAQRAAGFVRGNVSRWRVGDRRLPESERLPGSRYEQTRLNTCYTQSNADPAAFVDFALGGTDVRKDK